MFSQRQKRFYLVEIKIFGLKVINLVWWWTKTSIRLLVPVVGWNLWISILLFRCSVTKYLEMNTKLPLRWIIIRFCWLMFLKWRGKDGKFQQCPRKRDFPRLSIGLNELHCQKWNKKRLANIGPSFDVRNSTGKRLFQFYSYLLLVYLLKLKNL